MTMARRSTYAFAVVGFGLAAFSTTFVDSGLRRAGAETALERDAEMVSRLGLTDLCLFTEARYTRHLSQADLHTAFQDHPFSLDHFPSGSLVSPPKRIGRYD